MVVTTLGPLRGQQWTALLSGGAHTADACVDLADWLVLFVLLAVEAALVLAALFIHIANVLPPQLPAQMLRGNLRKRAVRSHGWKFAIGGFRVEMTGSMT